MNFVYSVPVNRTLVNGTVPITGNPVCHVIGSIVYMYLLAFVLEQRFLPKVFRDQYFNNNASYLNN